MENRRLQNELAQARSKCATLARAICGSRHILQPSFANSVSLSAVEFAVLFARSRPDLLQYNEFIIYYSEEGWANPILSTSFPAKPLSIIID